MLNFGCLAKLFATFHTKKQQCLSPTENAKIVHFETARSPKQRLKKTQSIYLPCGKILQHKNVKSQHMQKDYASSLSSFCKHWGKNMLSKKILAYHKINRLSVSCFLCISVFIVFCCDLLCATVLCYNLLCNKF